MTNPTEQKAAVPEIPEGLRARLNTYRAWKERIDDPTRGVEASPVLKQLTNDGIDLIERIALAEQRVRDRQTMLDIRTIEITNAEKENDALFDENDALKAENERLKAPVSFREIEAQEGVAKSLPEASLNAKTAELLTKVLVARARKGQSNG